MPSSFSCIFEEQLIKNSNTALFDDKAAWKTHLAQLNITNNRLIRIATEGALLATLSAGSFPSSLPTWSLSVTMPDSSTFSYTPYAGSMLIGFFSALCLYGTNIPRSFNGFKAKYGTFFRI